MDLFFACASKRTLGQVIPTDDVVFFFSYRFEFLYLNFCLCLARPSNTDGWWFFFSPFWNFFSAGLWDPLLCLILYLLVNFMMTSKVVFVPNHVPNAAGLWGPLPHMNVCRRNSGMIPTTRRAQFDRAKRRLNLAEGLILFITVLLICRLIYHLIKWLKSRLIFYYWAFDFTNLAASSSYILVVGIAVVDKLLVQSGKKMKQWRVWILRKNPKERTKHLTRNGAKTNQIFTKGWPKIWQGWYKLKF